MHDQLLLALFLGVPGAACVAAGILAWRGVWRAWARRPAAPFFFNRRSYLPFQVGLAGLGILAVWPALTASLEDWPNERAIWTVLAAVGAPLVVGARFWWPPAAAPRWHKDWVRRGGGWETPLWGPDEQAPARAARREGHGR